MNIYIYMLRARGKRSEATRMVAEHSPKNLHVML